MATIRILNLQIIFWLTACSLSTPVSIDYYSNNDRISGKSPPTPPILFYEPQSHTFSWTASFDPDTGNEVANYFFYYAKNKLPSYFLDENFFLTSEGQKKKLQIDWNSLANGTHYFWVTGFDGGRESLPSNIVELVK